MAQPRAPRAAHPWPRTVAEARPLQEALRSRVIARDRIGRVRHVAGVDASYDRTVGVTRAAVAVLAFPGLERVSQRVGAALRDGAETIGAVLRTRAGVRPVYVSIGHRLGLETAIEYVLRCAPRYRLPEPIRRADALASG